MGEKTILLVEDNPDDEVLVARDGAQALDCLLGSSGRPGRIRLGLYWLLTNAPPPMKG